MASPRRWDDRDDSYASSDDDSYIQDVAHAGDGLFEDDADDVAVPFADLQAERWENENDEFIPDEICAPEKIHVEWSESISPDWTPELHTFFPCRRPGNDPTVFDVKDKDAIDIFLACTGPLLDIIITETMIGGSQNLGKGWTIDLTQELMYRFLAALVYMSYTRKPSVRMYWSDSVLMGDIFCKSLITESHFLKILNNLRVAPYDLAIKHGYSDKTSPLYDPLWKVRDGINIFFRTIRKIRHPLKLLAVDERIARFHGRCAFRTKVPGKPCDTGLKWWLLCESDTLMIVNAILHCNYIELELEKELGRNSAVVYSLFSGRNLGNNYSLLNQGYEFHCDRLFSSPHLFLEMAAHSTYGVGTVKEATKHVPKTIVGRTKPFVKFLMKTEEAIRAGTGVQIDTGTASLGRGNCIYKYCGDILVFCTWIDSKPVYLLSSLRDICDELVYCKRNARVFKTGIDHGKYEPKEVLQPVIARRYNAHMGPIDSVDYHLSSWRHFKGRKWSVMAILELFRFGIMNSLSLMRERDCISGGSEKIRMHSFQLALIRGLLGKANCIELANVSLRNRSLLTAKNSAVQEARNQASAIHVGVYRGKNAHERVRCVNCRKSYTNHYCNNCDIPICKKCFGVYPMHQIC